MVRNFVDLAGAPADYFRSTRNGATWLLERAGFEPLEFIPIGGLMTRVGLSTIRALNRVLEADNGEPLVDLRTSAPHVRILREQTIPYCRESVARMAEAAAVSLPRGA